MNVNFDVQRCFITCRDIAASVNERNRSSRDVNVHAAVGRVELVVLKATHDKQALSGDQCGGVRSRPGVKRMEAAVFSRSSTLLPSFSILPPA